MIVFASDGSRLFTQGARDGSILSWDLTGDAGADPTVVLQTEKRSGLGLFADPHGRYLIAVFRKGVWKVPLDGTEPTLLVDGLNKLSWGPIDPSGRLLAHRVYGKGIPTIVVQDLESGKRWELDGPGDGGAGHWFFDSVGRLVVSRGGVLSRWDPTTEATELLLSERHAAAVPMPDGRFYVSGETRFILDLEDGSRTDFPSAYQREDLGYPLIFDSTRSIVLTGKRSTGEIRVGRLFDEEPHILLAQEGGFVTIRLSPDGRWIAATHKDGTIRLWPVPDLSKRPLHTLPYNQLMAKLLALTNKRIVPDEESTTGYRVEPDFKAYRGWQEVPEW